MKVSSLFDLFWTVAVVTGGNGGILQESPEDWDGVTGTTICVDGGYAVR